MQDDQSECIYNLLEKQKKQSDGKLFKSKFPHNIPPTGSTFINRNTTRPGVANLSGDYVLFKGGHEFKFSALTFGTSKGAPPELLRPTNTAPVGQFRLKREGEKPKPPVPTMSGLKQTQMNNKQAKTSNNFILSNAIDAALLQAPIKKPEIAFNKEKTYGRVPNYLSKVKVDIEKEYRVYQRNMRISRGQPADPIDIKPPSKAELIALRERLKLKWDTVNKTYGNLAHKTKIDTIVSKEAKLTLEKEMNLLEAEIRKLRIMIQDAQ